MSQNTTGTELIPLEALNAAVVFGEGGVDQIVERVRAEVAVASKDLDISTPTGRQKISSIAYKVSRSKTALDEMGKELVSGLKQQAAKIDVERKRIRDSLDAIRDDVRRPLDEWEAAEKRRTEQHEEKIKEIENVAIFDLSAENSTQIKARVERLRQIEVETRSTGFQEFGQRYVRAFNTAGATLTAALAAAEAREQSEIEAEKRRREEQERAQKERDERLQREAAERATAEAAAKARAEKEQLEREKRDAEQRAKDAERRAEAEKKAAVERERARVAAQKAKEEAEAARREENKRIRARVHKAISAALVSAGLSDGDAAKVVIALADGKVPHVCVTY